MSEKKIGLMGGTFDPPHLGHLEIAKKAVEQLSLERLILLPTGKPPHKNIQGLSAPEHRLAMTGLLKERHPAFELGLYDFNKQGSCYTYETVQYFSQELGLIKQELFFIIGADLLQEFPGWVKPELILKYCTLACAPRPEILFSEAELKELPEHIKLSMPALDISSTKIRQAVAENESLEGLTFSEIINYIRENELYQK